MMELAQASTTTTTTAAAGNNTPFEGRMGFGDPAVPVGSVMSAVGRRPPVRIAYLDSVKHKNR
jgi:hypothetical protein